MLSLEECLDFCELDIDEIEAIAEHEHIPVIVAAEYGCEMLKTPDGVRNLRGILRDNIDCAESHGQAERALRFRSVYRHFCATHPS